MGQIQKQGKPGDEEQKGQKRKGFSLDGILDKLSGSSKEGTKSEIDVRVDARVAALRAQNKRVHDGPGGCGCGG
jgi:hypothetical protein